jgi:hypothetical protein
VVLSDLKRRRCPVKIAKILLLAAAVTSAAVLPIMADQPTATGRENALARVDVGTAKHLEVLNGLLSKVPEHARPAIQKAIEASRHGRDTALAALTKERPHDGEGSATDASRPSQEGGKPATTGLEHAARRSPRPSRTASRPCRACSTRSPSRRALTSRMPSPESRSITPSCWRISIG